MDEPTTGLDPATRKQVWNSVESLQCEDQVTVFLTTHYMEEAAAAGHIAIIDKGKMCIRDSANIGHEARIGRISDEAVFYLMSRGISEEDARAMIVSGLDVYKRQV